MILDQRLAPFDVGAAELLALELRVLRAVDLGEERGQLVVLVLRPALERMIVALVAVEAHGQEQLRRVLHRGVRRRAAPCNRLAGGLSRFEPDAVRMS